MHFAKDIRLFRYGPEPKVVKNRVHLDVQVGGGRAQPWEVRWPRVTEAVERLTTAGATVIRQDALEDGTPDHVVMADPEGNEFCVL
ncbi:MAG: VOC family protein [Micromonospora sp.]